MEQAEVEYEESEYQAWLRHPCTRKVARHNEQRVKDLRSKLESASKRSVDADVREAVSELAAAKVILAELTGVDNVGGQQ